MCVWGVGGGGRGKEREVYNILFLNGSQYYAEFNYHICLVIRHFSFQNPKNLDLPYMTDPDL